MKRLLIVARLTPRTSFVRHQFRRVRRRPKSAVLLFALIVFLAVNLLAFVHARALTHFVDGGSQISSPLQLSRTGKVAALLTGVRLPKPVNTTTPKTYNLSYETHRYHGADGTEFEAWRIPARKMPWQRSRGTVLLFHGYANCKAGVLREADVMRRAGYDAFLVDFRGCGGSSGSVTTIGYREADDVAVAVNYVRQKLKPRRVVVYGRSMGAAAAMRAVSTGKVSPDAMILESPFDRMLTTVSRRFDAAGVPSFPFASLTVFWGGVQHGYWAFDHNPVEYARSVQCPTLMIRAGRDPFITQGEADAIFHQVKGPKRMVTFENALHQPCVDVDRDRWARGVTDFVRSGLR